MKKSTLATLIMSSLLLPAGLHAEDLGVTEIIQRVIDHHPSIKSAAIQLEKANQVSAQVQSQLGWQLGAQGGISRDISFFGTPSDILNASANMNRLLESGASMGLTAGMQYTDGDDIPGLPLPNPATSTDLEFNYRQPLGKGADNPAITEGLASARAGITISQAQVLALYDQLAGQIIELYGSALTTHEQINNTESAIKRTVRLLNYQKERSALGISEEKDLLQVNAQLHAQQAQLSALQLGWQQQQISFNRLMGTDWNSDLNLSGDEQQKWTADATKFDALFTEIGAHNAQLKSIDGQIQLADSKIKSQRDAKKDKLDLVLFIGNKTSEGDLASGGSINNSDVVGGVRMEYAQSVDSSGLEAALYQAQLERGLAIQEKRKTLEDLHYQLAAILAEINASQNVVKAYTLSLKSEKAKLDEAEDRYRQGRTDTDTLIQFENQMSATELTLSLQQIKYHMAYLRLALLRGALMKNIKLPEFDLSVDKLFEGEKS